jgi:hypothetical protein
MYKQNPPFCVQVELVEGCNFYCDFCGLQGIRAKAGGPYKFLKKNVAKKIATEMAEAGWNSRIEFAMHGEPTMHPERAEIVSIFREALPRNQLMMTSNGGGLVSKPGPLENIKALFDAGLNVLALDNYEAYKIVPKIMERSKKGLRKVGIKVTNYPQNIEASPHKRWPRDTKVVVVVADISTATVGSHASLNNHCGSGAPLDFSAVGKRCAKPFREMTTRWDGRVAFCCNDWRGVLEAGDVRNETMEEIWHGKVYKIMRKLLYHGDRSIPPCYGCNALSYRTALLPDHKGLETLGRASNKERAFVTELAEKGQRKPMTKPVKREWERGRKAKG